MELSLAEICTSAFVSAVLLKRAAKASYSKLLCATLIIRMPAPNTINRTTMRSGLFFIISPRQWVRVNIEIPLLGKCRKRLNYRVFIFFVQPLLYFRLCININSQPEPSLDRLVMKNRINPPTAEQYYDPG